MVDGDALVEKLPVAVAPQRTSLWRDALRRFRRHRLALIGTTVLLVMVVAVVAGPLAWRLPVNEIDFKQKLKGPTWSHPLGTDDLGQDLLARMLYGGRISLAVGVAAMLIAISLGTAIGAASGYMGGAVDHTLMRLTDLFLSIPALPLLLLIVYLFRDALKKAVGPEAGVFVLIVVVIGGLRWMPVARLVRAQFLSLREKEFVEAARGLGAPPLRQVVRHILPNAPEPIVHGRRDRPALGDGVEDQVAELRPALAAHEHLRPGELHEPVAAAVEVVEHGDRVHGVRGERPAAEIGADDTSARGSPRVPHEAHAGDLEEPAALVVALREAVLDRMTKLAPRHLELYDDIGERQETADVAPGEGAHGHRAVAADRPAVDERDVALEALAHHVGDEVAEVRLLRRELARVRLEGHGRAADDDVEILGDPLRIARHQRRDDGVGRHALAHLAERPRALDEPPVPRDPEVHLHQIARVRARLRDERLALLGDQRLVLVAAQDHVDAGGAGERSVGGHPLMGDRHDELRPARPQPRRRLPARDARIAEDDVGARARDPRGLGRREPEEADREAVEGQEEVGPRAAEDTPGGSVHHVGRQPRELRLGHALAERVGAEVELVVAEGREGEPDRIERRDHLRAAQHPGLDGRRQRGAREDEATGRAHG